MDTKPQVATLSNQLKVITLRIPSAKSVSFYVGVNAGQRYETSDTSGLAHFLEHMLFEGTSQFPDARALSEYIENVGGVGGAFTEKEYVTYNVKILPEKFSVGLDYLLSVLFHPILPIDAIEKEKGIVTEEINRAKDNPEVEIFEEWLLFVFGKNSWIGRSVLGTKNEIESVDQKKLKDYLKKFYQPSNMIFSIVGNFTKNQKQTLLRHLENLKSTNTNYVSAKNQFTQNSKHIKVIQRQTEQVQYNLGFITDINFIHKNRYTLELLGDILGGGSSARIFHSLVYDLGIAYSSMTYSWLYKDFGLLLSSGGVSENNLEIAIQKIVELLSDLKQQKIAKDELKRSQERMKANLLFSQETPEGISLKYLLQQINEKKILSIQEIVEQIESVTAEQIQDVANQIFSYKNLYLLIRGHINQEVIKKIDILISQI